MRKYTGKYPNNIREISGTFAPGIALVKTNNGAAYYIRACDTGGYMPKLGNDIFTYKFTRAQPMTFKQEGTRFSRILDSYPVEFVEYVARELDSHIIHLSGLAPWAKRSFITDMAKQGVLPRFQENA